MFWVTILLSIIEAIPSIITVVKDIWEAIHNNPGKRALFETLLVQNATNPGGARPALESFHAQHVPGSKYAAPAAAGGANP